MGLGIARGLVSLGAKVFVCTNEQDSLEEALVSIGPDSSVSGTVADVSISADMRRLVSETVARFGGVDVLVNSAGIQRYGTVVDTSEQTWDEVFEVNIKGVFLASKFTVPEMVKRGGGSIVNIASVQAYASQTNVAAYTASKGAIVALTRAMALDHAGDKIRVNVICPAAVDTPMLRWAANLWKGGKSADETLAAWGGAHPCGRIGTVEEIAALAAFLAGDECRFMTGADLKVDGGVLSKLGIILPD